MNSPLHRPQTRAAGPELLCLQRWEETASWLLEHTAKWPKSSRFALVQKVDKHALDVLEMLVIARYVPDERLRSLREINLRLELLRFLLHMAKRRGMMPTKSFETSMRGIDELGRMLHDWRVTLGR